MAITANVKVAQFVARQAHADTDEVRAEVAALKAQVGILRANQIRDEGKKARYKVIIDGGMVVMGIVVTIVLLKVHVGWVSAPIGAAPTAIQVTLERVWKL